MVFSFVGLGLSSRVCACRSGCLYVQTKTQKGCKKFYNFKMSEQPNICNVWATHEPDKVLADIEPEKEDSVLLVEGLDEFKDNQAFL